MAKPMRALFRNPPLIALLLILAIPSGGWGAEKNDAGTPSAAVPPPAQIQELRAGLAASNRFYLELHLAERAFYLCHSGVTLRTYPFQDPSLGVAHILCFTKRADHPWLNSVWSYGNLDPPLVINRIKIQPGVESTRPTPDAAGVVPPTLEEISPIPPHYRMVFANDLCLEIHLTGAIPGATRPISPWRERWEDFLLALNIQTPFRLRLRLNMAAKDGAALYRSFPELPSMLVLP